MSPRDLKAYNIYEGHHVTLEFEGGVVVSGEIITGSRNLMGAIILISFKNCTVTYGDQILFQPEWGVFDMAVGKSIVSAFSGPADVKSFDLITHVPSSQTIKPHFSKERLALEQLYAQVRDIREKNLSTEALPEIFEKVKKDHSEDWLLSVELYELATKHHLAMADDVLKHLHGVAEKRPDIAHLIDGGVSICQPELSI